MKFKYFFNMNFQIFDLCLNNDYHVSFSYSFMQRWTVPAMDLKVMFCLQNLYSSEVMCDMSYVSNMSSLGSDLVSPL